MYVASNSFCFKSCSAAISEFMSTVPGGWLILVLVILAWMLAISFLRLLSLTLLFRD